MKIKVIAPVFAALALSAAAPSAFAEDCSAIEDKKEKKKCEKKAKAQAKADARSTPYTPSTVSPALAGWDGENNPFATDEYRVRVSETGIQAVDDYLGKAFKMQAIVVGSKFIVDEIGKGNADAIKAAPALVPMLAEVPTLGQELVGEGQGLVTSLPSQLAGPDALKLPKVLPALKDGVSALGESVKEAPQILGSLKEVAGDPGAAAGAAAGVAADESGATDAVEGAKDAVDEATPE